MINSIQPPFYTPAAASTLATSSTSTSPTDTSSTAFQDELGSQLPDILTAFESPFHNSSALAASTAATSQPASSTDVPTAQSVFGDQPWVQNPTGSGPNGATWGYNPIYFATEATAEKVASMVGGTVIQQEVMTPTPGSPLVQSQLNEMVQLKDGSVVNPGLIADFYDHGYSQSFVDQMIQNEIKGV